MRGSDVENEIERMSNNRKEMIMKELMINFKDCKIKSAEGTKGFILYTMNDMNDDILVFRVYNEDHTFTDYDLLHSDLEVTINGGDATFYEFEDGRNILDHSYDMSNIDEGIDRNTIVVNEYDIGTEEGFKKFILARNKL